MSRRTNFLVFDEYVPLGTVASAPAYTSADLNGKLAQYDQLAIQVIIDNVTKSANAGFALNIQHSANGRTWAFLNSASTPEVTIAGLTTSQVNLAFGSYPSATVGGEVGALLGHVRFVLQFTEATTAAHVKVYVTQRDQAK